MTNRRSGVGRSVFDRGGRGWTPTEPIGLGPLGAQEMPDLSERGPNAEDDDWDDLPDEDPDRFAALRAEHRELKDRIEELRAWDGPEQGRIARWNAIATALEANAQAEEELLYPRLEAVGGVGKMSKGAQLGHKRMRELALRIEARPESDLEYHDLLDELERVSRHHAELEEHFLLPLAEQVLGRREVHEIVAAYVRRRNEVAAGPGR